MAEELTLTSAFVYPQKTTTGYKVARLDLNPEQQRFLLIVKGTQGERIEAIRTGAVAMTLMNQLRTANGTIKSLDKRAIEWLQTQPEGLTLVGTITGSPD
jgi:hypothetical protein